MAGQEGKKYNLKKSSGQVLSRTPTQRKYFYLDGKLYRTLKADRGNDLLRAWSYMDNRIETFVLSSVRKVMTQAFDTDEVATLLNRTKKNIFLHVSRGAINAPYKIGVQESEDRKYTFGYFKWSEDDVLALHEHYLTVGSGRPRKDGIVGSATRIPSRLELIAMMKQNKMYYVQDSRGNFVPIFDQPDWT